MANSNLQSDQESAASLAGAEVSSPNMLQGALDIARDGIPVFPLHNPDARGSCSCGAADCSSKGKHPRTGRGFKDATTDEMQIRRWWKMWTDANIGIPTGSDSGIFVIDIDGEPGATSIQRLRATEGPIPATKTVVTGRGYQLYFRHPGHKMRNAAPIYRAYPGIDSRGDGGYVVAAPSLHASGRRYTEQTSAPSQIADAPQWLIDFINKKPGTKHAGRESKAANGGFKEGGRNSALTSLAGVMRRRGMSQQAIEAALLAENAANCDPPLDDDEVRRIAASVARYEPGAAEDIRRSLTDKGNADRFAARYRDSVRYVAERGVWIIWTGMFWRIDSKGEVMELAKQVAVDIYNEGDPVTDPDLRKAIVKHSCTSQQVN